MKKILSLLLILCVVLSMVACTKTEPASGETTPTTQATDAPTDPTDAPTDPTDAPVDPTDAPVDPTDVPVDPTDAPIDPTEAPTQAPTQKPTQAPTQKPTQAPTQKPTQAPTQKPTQAPTQKPTQAPTQKPTQAPTQKPTQAPTQKPTDPIETSNTILKGTAVIDGKVDDAYLSSYCVVVDYTMPFNVPVASPDKIQAKTYFLHDGEHLYVVAEVTGDSAVVDTGLISWVSDSVEVWFSNPAGMSSKIVMDAYATPWPHNATNDRENKMKIDLNQVELAVVRNDNGYTVEMKTDIPYYRKSEGTVAINVQLNNVYAADSDASNWDARNGGCFGTQPAKHQPIVVELSE